MDLTITASRVLYRASTQNRLRLWRKLSRLLANGVPIVKALQELRSQRMQASGEGHSECVALDQWIRRMSNGLSLGQAVDGWTTEDERMLISAGEERGNLSVAFGWIEQILTARNRIVKAVIGGVSYPLVLACMAAGLLVLYSYRIIPVYANVSRDHAWTGLAASMVWLANTVRAWIWVAGGSGAALLVLFLWSLPRWDGWLRVRFDRLAPYSIYRIMKGSAWLISLAAMVGVGRRIEDSLIALQGQQSGAWAVNRTNASLTGIRRGLSLGAALKESNNEFPDREVIADMLVYSQLSGVDESLRILANELLESSVERVQAQTAVLKNIGVMLMAGLIAWTTGGLMNMNLQLAHILQGGP